MMYLKVLSQKTSEISQAVSYAREVPRDENRGFLSCKYFHENIFVVLAIYPLW